MNADSILFRASSVSKLMTEPKSKSDILSKTTIAYLVQLYVKIKYGREQELENKYLTKGTEEEENALTIYSLNKNRFFKKNEKNFTNLFVSGTPDIIDGDTVIDIKTSYNIFTFFKAKNENINTDYWYQLQVYMALTGCTKALLSYCLVNTSYHLVQSELYRESYKHADNNTPAAIELNIIANHVYDRKVFDEYINRRGCPADGPEAKEIIDNFVEVPLSERIFEFKIARDEKEIERLYERVKVAREWMNKLFT